eukprot:6211887-Pleurochrysis_carterae.AAC.3
MHSPIMRLSSVCPKSVLRERGCVSFAQPCKHTSLSSVGQEESPAETRLSRTRRRARARAGPVTS